MPWVSSHVRKNRNRERKLAQRTEAPPLPVTAAGSWRRGPGARSARPLPAAPPAPPRRPLSEARCMLSSCRRLLPHVLVPSCPPLTRTLRLFPLHLMKPLVVFVLGGPGAGKGTQCARIVEVRPCGRATESSRAERSGPGPEGAAALAAAPLAVGSGLRVPTATARPGRGASSLRVLCFRAPLLPLLGSGSSRYISGCQSPANRPRGTRPGSCGS
jgi:hypothetical protein